MRKNIPRLARTKLSFEYSRARRHLTALTERLSGLNMLWNVYDQIENRSSIETFIKEALQLLNIEVAFDEKEMERITSSGPVVVVCNHPHGALDGLLLAHFLLSVRKDVKFMANPILKVIEEINDLFFFVNPNSDVEARINNISSTKKSIRWLDAGGLLALFPAGEVSHINWNSWKIRDQEWNSNVAKIVKTTKATVVPIHISGNNSVLFQILGLVHPALRTFLLPRELLNQRRNKIQIRIGKPISFSKLPVGLSNEDLTRYFRFRSNLLSNNDNKKKKKSQTNSKVLPSYKHRIAPHDGTRLLVQEIEKLPVTQLLARSGTNSAYYASAEQIPQLLNEIGRLREKTFRRVGEGTGLSRDLDEFDAYYLHLFVWNEESKEIVGAYRVGKTDEIIAQHGIKGLYTSRLFKYDSEFVQSINPGLELGRSFIRPKYQKSLSSLPLLWKGIARFLHRNPHYQFLFGPVSISNDYSIVSKNLMVDFIRENSFDADLSKTVEGMTPFRTYSLKKRPELVNIASFLRGMDELSDLVSDLETDFDGVPILLRHYLRLGGKLLAFNVDKEFANSLDGLIRVDLLNVNKKMIQMYMGKEQYEDYCAYHSKKKLVQPNVA